MDILASEIEGGPPPAPPVRYQEPDNWIKYDLLKVATALIDAKAAVKALTTTPYQRDWVDALQEMQLKREVAGTSRIEGAEFTERELDVALQENLSVDAILTKSQKQAHAAMRAYKWIEQLPKDFPVTQQLILEVHRHLVTGCDDDHCEPGALRGKDYNVLFGIPRHRGAEGGDLCSAVFDRLMLAVQREFKDHDLLIQALALHYHLAAMHPFMDGNGRTSRALEALMLQRAGLSDRAFIAMSNYYYDEQRSYLAILSEVRRNGYDLTDFLVFGLTGITLQCNRLYAEIKKHMERALFRNMMYNLFNRLVSTRKRVIQDRQLEILKILLTVDKMDWFELLDKTKSHYNVQNYGKMVTRDMASLQQLGAISVTKVAEAKWNIAIRPQWPQEITESDFFQKVAKMPKGKTYKFLP